MTPESGIRTERIAIAGSSSGGHLAALIGVSNGHPGLEGELGQLAELASPVSHVDPRDPPLLLFHGDQDPQMPINQSHELEGGLSPPPIGRRLPRRAWRRPRRQSLLRSGADGNRPGLPRAHDRGCFPDRSVSEIEGVRSLTNWIIGTLCLASPYQPEQCRRTKVPEEGPVRNSRFMLGENSGMLGRLSYIGGVAVALTLVSTLPLEAQHPTEGWEWSPAMIRSHGQIVAPVVRGLVPERRWQLQPSLRGH